MAKSRHEILSDIVPSLQRYMDWANSKFPHWTSSRDKPIPDLDIPPLSLTSATERFTLNLLRDDIPPQVSQAVLLRASQMANIYQDSFAKACQHLTTSSVQAKDPSSLTETIQRLRCSFEHIYEHRHLAKLLSAKAMYESKLQECQPGSTRKERKPFNQEFTPFLDVYFRQNAFPSAADRKALATKGGMSPRQIEVWFQNHRNRAKKDGQTLKRLAPGAVNMSFISSFIGGAMDGDSVADDASDDEDTAVEEDSQSKETPQPTALDNFTPRDRIPEGYASLSIQPCTSDCKAFGFPTPSRNRRAALSQTQPVITVDELIVMFSVNLHLRGAPRTASRRSQSPSPLNNSWYHATTTVPCPAPHPALVRSRSPKCTTESSAKPTSAPWAFVPTNIPTLPSILPSWERYTPRRPKPAPFTKRAAPYARPCRSKSTTPHSSPSRVSSTSSLSSIYSASSSDSRSTSTSSSASSATYVESSPELTTPPQSPTPNDPQTFDSAQDNFDLFGDSYIDLYSQTQGTCNNQLLNGNVMSISMLGLPPFVFEL